MAIIGFKVEVGFVPPGENFEFSKWKSYIYDTNSYCLFLTDRTMPSNVRFTSNQPTEAKLWLSDNFGDDFNYLTGIVSDLYQSRYDPKLDEWITTAYDIAPNTLKAAKNYIEESSNVHLNNVVHIKGTNYLIAVTKVLDKSSLAVIDTDNGDVLYYTTKSNLIAVPDASYNKSLYMFYWNDTGTRINLIPYQFVREQTQYYSYQYRLSQLVTDALSDVWTWLIYQGGVKPNADTPDNPYEPGGPSGPTDPSIPPGTFDDSSDPIPDSSLPTISAANTGFTRIYNPTLSEVQLLAHYLWTTPDVIQTIWNHIAQFFEDPMQAIIGFNLVPVPVPDAGQKNFSLVFIDTGIAMNVAANQFVDVDCGTVQIQRYYGSALDQSPFTKISCFLPFIGTVNLNTDEVMGTTLQCKYRVDIVSGSCVAKILVDGNCIYQFSGHCAITIPFSSADFSSYVSAAISVGKLAAAALTAGASAAAAAGVEEVAQQTNQVVTTTQQSTAKFGSSGEFRGATMMSKVETRESPADQSSTQASFSGLSPQNVANTVGQIMSSKPYIEHSGSFSGNSGYLGVRRPFLIIERPNMCMPENYQALNGFPSMITLDLSTCKGFTRVQQVQLTGLSATNPEQAEIMEFLKNGVIL